MLILFELLIEIILKPNVINIPNPVQPSFISVAHAEDYPPHKQEWNEENIKLLIRTKAKEYGVSAERMEKTIECESQFIPDVQSFHIRHDGTREESYGLVQFFIPAGNKTQSGETITEEMAKNPVIAVETMAWYFSLGKQNLWTCYRMLYGSL